MYQFDRAKAETALKTLTLSPTERIFCDWWLEMMQAGESLLTLSPPPVVADGIVTFEVYDGAAYWTSAGARITQELGGRLVGMDYVQMAPERDRPVRLERMTAIANGAVGQQQRQVISQRGRVHFIRELAVPYGLSSAGHPRTMTYVEADTDSTLGGIDRTKGVMNLAPQFAAHKIA